MHLPIWQPPHTSESPWIPALSDSLAQALGPYLPAYFSIKFSSKLHMRTLSCSMFGEDTNTSPWLPEETRPIGCDYSHQCQNLTLFTHAGSSSSWHWEHTVPIPVAGTQVPTCSSCWHHRWGAPTPPVWLQLLAPNHSKPAPSVAAP